MPEEENIFGKLFDAEEFIRAPKGSGPATSPDTPNTSAAPHDLELTVREKTDFALRLCLVGRRAT